MSTDDLERYEAEIELQLYKEYKDVCPMFSYVVETERRFYLANSVERSVHESDGRTYVELELRDAWVWDMYRQTALRRVRADRHVQRREHRGASQGRPAAVSGRGLGGRPSGASMTRRRLQLGADGEALAAAWYEAHGYAVLARNWRCREGEIDLIVHRGRAVVICEVKTRTSEAFGVPAEAVTAAKQRKLRALASAWLDEAPFRPSEIRVRRAAVLGRSARDHRGRVLTDLSAGRRRSASAPG